MKRVRWQKIKRRMKSLLYIFVNIKVFYESLDKHMRHVSTQMRKKNHKMWRNHVIFHGLKLLSTSSVVQWRYFAIIQRDGNFLQIDQMVRFRSLWHFFAIRRYLFLTMVFCYQNCSDLLWEKNVPVIKKNFWNLRLKAENFKKKLRSLEQFIQTVNGQNNFW